MNEPLTVEQTREMLAAPEGRERLNAAIARACEMVRVDKIWHWHDKQSSGMAVPPRFLTAEESGVEADHLAAEMWRALPREGICWWSHREEFQAGELMHYIAGQAFHLALTHDVEARTYRDALALALAACGMLTMED